MKADGSRKNPHERDHGDRAIGAFSGGGTGPDPGGGESVKLTFAFLTNVTLSTRENALREGDDVMLDLTVDQTIALRRHGKKLWSYRNNKPDVVEAAVLDYLRDNGCDGYFTGRDDYLSLFMSLAGWPGKVSNKMNPAFFPEFVYFRGSDGPIRLHKFSYVKAMAEVDATTIEKLSEKLAIFCNGRMSCRGYFSNLMQQPDHMISFLTALGISELQRLIKIDYPEAHLQSLRFLEKFNMQSRSLMEQREELLTPEGLALDVQIRGFPYGAILKDYVFDQINETQTFARYLKDEVLRGEFIEACNDVRKLREDALSIPRTATLDLQLWDRHGTAVVEVKAPGDKLMTHQIATLNLARAKGERACVISVTEE